MGANGEMALPNLGALRLSQPAAATGEWFRLSKRELNELVADGTITQPEADEQNTDPISLDPLTEDAQEGEEDEPRWVWKATYEDGGIGRPKLTERQQNDGVTPPTIAQRGLNYDPANYLRWLNQSGGIDDQSRKFVPADAIRELARGPPHTHPDGVDEDDRDRIELAESSEVESLIRRQQGLINSERQRQEAAAQAAAQRRLRRRRRGGDGAAGGAARQQCRAAH